MIYLWFAVAFELVADFAFKWAITSGRAMFVVGWILYIVAAWLWGVALKTVPLASGNTLFLTTNIILVAVGGVWFFKETLTVIQWVGIVLALVSVVLVGSK